MNNIILTILMAPFIVFANGNPDSQPTGQEMYDLAIKQIQVLKSAEVIFKTYAQRGIALSNRFLIEQSTDDNTERSFKRDARSMILEIGQWQSKSWKNGSSSYVEEVYLSRQGNTSAEWSFRRRFLLVALAGRITAASEHESQQRRERATIESGGNSQLYRVPLTW